MHGLNANSVSPHCCPLFGEQNSKLAQLGVISREDPAAWNHLLPLPFFCQQEQRESVRMSELIVVK